MRVLFVYTDVNIKGGEISCNHGIAVLSAVMKKHGHQTDLVYIDDSACDPAPLREKIQSFDPGVVAFSTMSAQFRYIKKLAKDIDTEGRKFFSICGGVHTTLAPQCIEEAEGLDAVCIGEGENTLLDLVQTLERGEDPSTVKSLWVRKDGEIIKNPCREFILDLDSMPFPDYEIFDYQKIIDSNYGRAKFFSSRGCPYSCNYCSNHIIRKRQEGKYVRYRTAESVIQEMEEVVSKYDIKVVFMEDDTFTLKPSLVYEFCDLYEKRIKLPFMMHTRAETVKEDVFRRLAEVGCFRVAIGVESGNPYIRREVLNRRMTNDQIKNAFRIAKSVGMVTKSFNIVGFPYETEEMFQDTVKLNAEINPEMVVINTFDPYPGTQLHDVCVKEGFITDRAESEDFIPRTDTILNMPQFPRERIMHCFRNFAFNVYRKNDLKKAIMYRVYYSRYGEDLIRLLSPIKGFLFSMIEKKGKKAGVEEAPLSD